MVYLYAAFINLSMYSPNSVIYVIEAKTIYHIIRHFIAQALATAEHRIATALARSDITLFVGRIIFSLPSKAIWHHSLRWCQPVSIQEILNDHVRGG